MEEGLLLVNDDFVILRKNDVFSYDGLTAVKSFSHSVSDKIKVEWVIITIIISGEAECTINGKNYRVQARDIIMSLPNYVLERRGGNEGFVCKLPVYFSFFISKEHFILFL